MDRGLHAELLEGIASLMLCDDVGEVHEVIDSLRKLVGLPALEGNKLDGWEEEDWEGLEDISCIEGQCECFEDCLWPETCGEARPGERRGESVLE